MEFFGTLGYASHHFMHEWPPNHQLITHISAKQDTKFADQRSKYNETLARFTTLLRIIPIKYRSLRVSRWLE